MIRQKKESISLRTGYLTLLSQEKKKKRMKKNGKSLKDFMEHLEAHKYGVSRKRREK